MIVSSSERAANVAALLAGAGRLTVLDADGAATEIDGSELDERGRRLAAGLEGLAIGPGDRVGCWLPNGVAYLTVLSACARLGAVAVAVNPRFRASEVQDIVGRSGRRALFAHPGFVGIDTEAILSRVDAAAMPRLEVVVPVVGTVDTAWPAVPFAQLAESSPSSTDNAQRDAPFAVFTRVSPFLSGSLPAAASFPRTCSVTRTTFCISRSGRLNTWPLTRCRMYLRLSSVSMQKVSFM